LTTRIQNIETINLTGEYLTTGIALTNVSGTTDLNLDTKLPGGTATVTDANALNAENINAGDNITTLNVTSLASGTRDTVMIDANAATAVSITGQTAGADLYDVTVAEDADVTLTTLASAGDEVTIRAAGDVTIDVAAANTALDLTIVADAQAIEATLDDAAQTAENIILSGSKDITLVVADTAAITKVSITDDTSGISRISIEDATTAHDLSDALVDEVVLAADWNLAGTVIVNENVTVIYEANQTAATVINIENADADLTTGTLTVELAEDQGTSITTGAKVDTLVLSATPDEVTDTDTDENGTAQDDIDVANLILDAATTTLAIVGDEDLTLTKVTGGAALVIAATSLTGDLTIGDVTKAATIATGSGDDSITLTTNAAFTVLANDGDDTLDLSAVATAATINGGAGNDTITGSTAADSIVGGAGADEIYVGTTGAADTVVSGDGADVIILQNGDDGFTVTDFDTASDVIVLRGTGVAVDLSDIDPTKGAYVIGSNAFDITLTGSTTSDLTGFVQLGRGSDDNKFADSYNISAGNDTDVVAGDKNDVITAGNTTKAHTIDLGSGSDIVRVAASKGVDIDNFSTSNDRLIITGTAAAGTLDLSSLAPVAGVYTILTNWEVTVSNGTKALTATDTSGFIQLGDATTAFTSGGTTTITGGSFDDVIVFGGTDQFNFTDDNGYDTITNYDTTADGLSFDDITGIDAGDGVAIAANATKVSDASDGTVYIFDSSSDGTGSAKIDTFTVDETNGITADVILADVADFLNAGLTASTGETYVAMIQDGGTAGDYYIYLINADSDGIQADDIRLIGFVQEAAGIDITAASIV
jgi:RTX calcium-binding nonapeptide repeat (4 copies)